jgi:hypothetical protein
MLKGSKRSACSRLPATATTIEGRSMSSGSRPSNCRLGWNIICRCGPALMWCHPPPSSGMVCCIRCGCGCSDIIHVSSHQMCMSDTSCVRMHRGFVPSRPYYSRLAPAMQPSCASVDIDITRTISSRSLGSHDFPPEPKAHRETAPTLCRKRSASRREPGLNSFYLARHAGRPGWHVVKSEGHRDTRVEAHQANDVGDADMAERFDRAVVEPLRDPA